MMFNEVFNRFCFGRWFVFWAPVSVSWSKVSMLFCPLFLGRRLETTFAQPAALESTRQRSSAQPLAARNDVLEGVPKSSGGLGLLI